MDTLDDAIEDLWRTAEEENIDIDRIQYSGRTRNGTEYNLRCIAETENFGFIERTFENHGIETRDAHINEDQEFEIIIDPATAED